MKIEKEVQDDCQAKLTVEYSQDEFEGFKRRAAKKIAKNAKIPGFRPGKAPYNVIVNHYGEGAILQEALDILLDDDYSKMLEEAEIEPSGPGNVENIEQYDPPKIEFVVPLEPEVNLGDYREIRKNYELEEFDLGEVDDFIENMRRNSATIIPSENPAKEGDLVYFNLSGEFLNPESDEDASITDKTPQQVVVPGTEDNSKSEWPFSGFARELLGVEAGETKEIQHTYPEDHEEAAFQGKTALFTIEVQSVKELELPDFDEEFVQTLGNYDSPEDLREKMEARLREEHQNSYEREYFNELLNEISENTNLNYPPQMLEHEGEHVLEDIKSRLDKQNMEFETYLKLRDMDEEAFMAEEIRPVAKERLERTLIVDALIETEGLKLDQEMLQKNINDVMTEVFYSGNAQEMQKEMGKEEFSRAISMEGVQRTMNEQLQERLKLIATGQPIPEDKEEEELPADSAEGLEEDIDRLDEVESAIVDVKNEEDVEEEVSEDLVEETATGDILDEEPEADEDEASETDKQKE